MRGGNADARVIIMTSGLSPGINVVLHLVARLHSEEEARGVRLHTQYDPEPPFD